MALTVAPLFGPEQPGMLFMEKETTFAVDPDSAAKFVRVIDNPQGIENIQRYMMEDESLRETLNKRPMIPGFEDGSEWFVLPPGTTITTKAYLAGFSSSLPVAKTAYSTIAHLTTGCPTIWMAYALLGGIFTQDAFEVLAAGSTVNNIKITDTSDYDAGAAVTVDVSATAVADYETFWVKTNANTGPPDELTARVDLSAAPDTAKQSFGSVVVYDKSFLTDSYTFTWTGHKAAATTPLRLKMAGCVPSAGTIDIPAFGLPTIEVTWMVTAAKWDDTSATGASAQTWAYPAPEQAVGHRATFIPLMATDAAVDLKSTSITISIDNGLNQLAAHSATYGVFTDVKTSQSISIALHAPYTAALRQAFRDQTEDGIEIEIGSQPGRRIAIALPSIALEAFNGPVSDGGVAYCDMTARTTTYTGDTGTLDEDSPGDKAIGIAWS